MYLDLKVDMNEFDDSVYCNKRNLYKKHQINNIIYIYMIVHLLCKQNKVSTTQQISHWCHITWNILKPKTPEIKFHQVRSEHKEQGQAFLLQGCVIWKWLCCRLCNLDGQPAWACKPAIPDWKQYQLSNVQNPYDIPCNCMVNLITYKGLWLIYLP